MHTFDDGSVLDAPRSGQLSDRASEFRMILGARQEADAILADASEVRRAAGRQAELLVAEAEVLSRDLTDQARSVLDRATGEARERAEGILAVARASAEGIRRSAEAHVVADREAFRAEMESVRREQDSVGGQTRDDALADIETIIRSLGTTLRQARGSVTDAGDAISLLRTQVAGTAGPAPLTEAAQTEERPEESTELRPLGWLFRSDRS